MCELMVIINYELIRLNVTRILAFVVFVLRLKHEFKNGFQ